MMKKLAFILSLGLLFTGLQSCEKIKGLFDVEFETTLHGDMDIELSESAMKSTGSYSFSSTASIDPLDDDEVAEYADKIRSFAVDGVFAEVLYVDKGDVTFLSGTSFSVSDGSTTATWTLASDWSISEGTTVTLEDLGGIYEIVAEILDKKEVFTVSIQGESSVSEVEITVRLGIDTTVTGNPL